MLTARVQTIISHNNLVAPGDLWVVAVSGGADSLALLHLLYTLRKPLSLNLYVATYDHGLRGDAGAEDARFVVETAQTLNLPVTAGQGNVYEHAVKSGEGIEAAARHQRYDFLAAVARKIGAAAVVTAHHADDQAETVLMHVLRGSGLDGLRGMVLSGEMPGHADIRLLRPLLDVTRAELEAYCTQNGLNPRKDATNMDTKYLRNHIRHEIMPKLRAINPQVDAALLRLAESAAIDSDYLRQQTGRIAQSLLTYVNERTFIQRDRFTNLDAALQRRIIQYAVTRLTDEAPGYEHILNAVRVAMTGTQGAIVQFPGGVQLRLDYESLVIEYHDAPPAIPPKTPLLTAGQQVAVSIPGETVIPGANWSLAASHSPADASALLYVPTGATAVLRTRQPGERFMPCGMNGHTRSIKKWMIDRKIPQTLRDRVPILEINGNIAAILTGNQWQIDEKFAKSGKKLIKIYLFVDYS
jgi:tRNA(Ile)-lysidine synthetase-like protein